MRSWANLARLEAWFWLACLVVVLLGGLSFTVVGVLAALWAFGYAP